MKRLFIVSIFLFLYIPTIIWAADLAALKLKLNYLTSLPEISWVKFNNNDIIIGLNTYPKDFRSIINAAALHGNRAYGFGVRLWVVKRNATQIGGIQKCESNIADFPALGRRHGTDNRGFSNSGTSPHHNGKLYIVVECMS